MARFNIALRDQGFPGGRLPMGMLKAAPIARSMEIINTRLTSQDLQPEAIEAQRAMVGSPNHPTIDIPVGSVGVPLAGTFDLQRQPKPAPEAPPR